MGYSWCPVGVRVDERGGVGVREGVVASSLGPPNSSGMWDGGAGCSGCSGCVCGV